MTEEKKGNIKRVSHPKEVLDVARKIKSGKVILLILRKDLKWEKFILTVENNRVISGEPKLPSESDFKDAILALLVVPHTTITKGVEAAVESAGLDVEGLPEDIKKLVHLIPGIELFIPDKELVEAGVSETVITPDEIMDEVANVIENIIRELGLEGEVKLSNHELIVIVSKRVPKKIMNQLQKVLESRVGDLVKVKVVYG